MDLMKSFQKYVEKVLHVQLKIQENFRGGGLPYYIYDLYEINKIRILDRNFVVVIYKGERELTPESLKKQIGVISEKTGLDVIYVNPALSSFQRDRLIKYKLNFVVPYNQMYLPHLKLDLREHFKSVDHSKNKLSPASQAIILFSILHVHSQLDSEIIMENLNYSAMSVSRSFREISDLGIGEVKRNGKEKLLILSDSKKELWDKSKDLMISPVKQELWINPNFPFKDISLAGLSALSQYSMITPPKNKVYSIYREDWKKVIHDKSLKKLIEPIQTESNINLQVWSYPPALWQQTDIVDKYSLYLSLRDEEDERIEQALEEMMENI